MGLRELPTNHNQNLQRTHPNPNPAQSAPLHAIHIHIHGRNAMNPQRSDSRSRRPPQNQNAAKSKKKSEVEEDFHRITQRMRQIDIGKATDGYRNYLERVPRAQRKPHHPRTPNPRQKMPNKWWKKAINKWRKALHAFDDGTKQNQNQKSNSKTEQKMKVKEEQKVKMEDDAKDFCCEKCSDTFKKFDEWMRHRAQCKGDEEGKRKGKIKREVRLSDDEDEDFDLFHLDQDRNEKKDTTLKITIENEKATAQQESSPEIYDGSDEEDEDVDACTEKVVDVSSEPPSNGNALTLSLLDQLNNVLEEDEDGGLL